MTDRLREPAPPEELIDTEGEGIYLLTGWDAPKKSPGVLIRAARLFGVDWRDIDHETMFMRPSGGGDYGEEWLPTDLGPFCWKLLLPRRWRPVMYAYCTPNPAGTVWASDAQELANGVVALLDEYALQKRLDKGSLPRLQRALDAEAARDALAAALRRAVFLAEHLHQMVPRDVWREHGAEWMGQYEGDYHAEKVQEELAALAAVSTPPGRCPCGVWEGIDWPRNVPCVDPNCPLTGVSTPPTEETP